MTNFEVLTLAVAIVAVLLSLYTLSEHRKLQRESNDLQRVTADLAKRQMQQIDIEEAASRTVRLAVDICKDRDSHRIRISNVGESDAFNVDIQFELKSPLHDPLVQGDYRAKFPIKRLPGHTSITTLANIHMNTPPSFDGTLTWTDSDGTAKTEPFCVFLD